MTDLLAQLQATLGEGFRLERELGGGGMSRVFIAEEKELGRRVVIKVLPPELAAGVSIDRFRREIQLAASLQHPHIVPVHAAGQTGGLFYYTMPLIEGESLRSKLARGGELPVHETLRILLDVLDALAYAHEHGVVHRDIKPDNVLISGRHAVVTDFGVAKAISAATGVSSLTSAGVALGTPAYMAPEQAAADPHTDHRADIYAVGAVAYEMLTGRPPFTGVSPQMVLAAQVTQAPEPVTAHRPAVPLALNQVIMRCLEKKAADRWQSAEELHHQIEAMSTPSGGLSPVAGVSPVGGSVPVAVPSRPLLTRRRLLGIVAAVVLVVAVALGVVLGRRRPTAGASEISAIGLVVLPFDNLGAAEDQYFADGITEEITSRLSRLAGLAVIARTSALQYKNTNKSVKQIGDELNVQYVLEGTVRWEKGAGASRVRVSPQLIRVSDARSVWAEPYEAGLSGVFQLQADIAERVAQALSVTLLASAEQAVEERPTENLQAYDAFLRGNNYGSQGESERDTRLAIEMYERAVRLDPGFALAWAKLSRAHAMMYWLYYDRTDARLASARQALERAVALKPTLPEVRVAQAFLSGTGQASAPPRVGAYTGRPGLPGQQ